MLVAVLGDTHVPMKATGLPLDAWRKLGSPDLILHTGDVCEPGLLDELADLAPTHVAMGNCDPPEVRAWGARDVVELTVEGVRMAMCHDSGPSRGRAERLRDRFPAADVVVFGHSHLPLCERADGLLLLNPGSPTDRRRAPHHTLARLEAADGRARASLLRVGRA